MAEMALSVCASERPAGGHRAGIPFACEAGTPLARAPLLKALLAVLQSEVEDWPFRRLMAVLDSSYFQPDWSEWRAGRAEFPAQSARVS